MKRVVTPDNVFYVLYLEESHHVEIGNSRD